MRHATEGLFLSSIFLTNFASGMIQIASTKAIFDGTGKASDVALAVSMQLICQIVAQFSAGSLVDKFSSRSIAVLSRTLVMTGVAISAFFAFKDPSSPSIAGAIPLFLMSVLQLFIPDSMSPSALDFVTNFMPKEAIPTFNVVRGLIHREPIILPEELRPVLTVSSFTHF
jgi:MFS family permease